MKSITSIFVLHLITSTISLFFVDSNNPFALTPNLIPIKTVSQDFLTNGFLVSFRDGQARRYSPDFSSFTPLYFPEPVQLFLSSTATLFNINLSNNTIWTMIGNMTTTLSVNFTTLRCYSFPGDNLIQRYNFMQPILDYRGFPINTLQLNPLHIVFFNKTIKVLYNGFINVPFDISQNIGNNSYCSAFAFSNKLIQFSGDLIDVTFTYFMAVPGTGLIQINITVALNFNFATESYDLSTISQNHRIVAAVPYFITKVLIANAVVMMQDQSGGLFFYYNSNFGTILFNEPNIGRNPIQKFICMSGSYFIIYSLGVVHANIHLPTAQFIGSGLMATLPNNIYKFVASIVNILYVPQASYIYKTNCADQSYDNGNWICINYNCLVANCIKCHLTNITCGVCEAGYIRNDNLTCSIDNSTNSNNSIKSSAFYSLFPILAQFPFIQDIFWIFSNSSHNIISIPSMRKLSPMFYYFGNFDDLYLYMFHDRLYGATMNDLFAQISHFQEQKWSMLNYDEELRWLNIDKSAFLAKISFQDQYLTYNYTYKDHPAKQDPEGLLFNSINFFLLEVPMVFIIFILMHFLFRLLFRFPVSRFFRKFDLWCLFLMIIFEGNVQQLSFYLTADLRNTYFFSYGDKCLKSNVILFGLLLTLVSVGGFFITLSVYGILNKHLVDNNKNTIKGNAFILLQFGLRNMILGVLHSTLRALPYTTMLLILISTESIFFMLFIVSVSFGTYRALRCIWIYLLLNLIRIFLIFTLFFDYNLPNFPMIESIQCVLILLMIIVYIIGTLTAIFTFMAQFIQNIIKAFKNPAKMNEDQTRTVVNVGNQTQDFVNYIRVKYIKSLQSKTHKLKIKIPRIKKANTLMNPDHMIESSNI